MTAPFICRWDLICTNWSQSERLLDEGWEPFAVVQREPLSPEKGSQPTVYFKRERPEA
jgi:hypothetical protein